MNDQTLRTLQYDIVKEKLEAYAVSYAGLAQIRALMPMTSLTAVHRALDETHEALELLQRGSSVPIPSLEGIEWIMSLSGTGYMFGEKELTSVAVFLRSCGQLRQYMKAKEATAPRIAAYAASLLEMHTLLEEIERCIRFGRVEDQASKGLEKARKRIRAAKEKLHKRLDGAMSRYKPYLQENLYSQRGDRYVLPVKREDIRHIKGTVRDYSTSGQTVFVEPDELAGPQDELELLKAEEAREEGMVLSRLSGMVEAETQGLRLNIEVTGMYDFIFAKAKYGRSLHASAPRLNEDGMLELIDGRHPMLSGMVPLNIRLGEGYRSLVITGPNTGGKTVVLKTVGLLALMAQSGLLIPAGPDSRLPVFRHIRGVIGDGQSLEQSLSTFSAQMKAVDDMLRYAGRRTLMLIDELAAGTDPGEGIALSIAILEELHQRGASLIVTTHFNELKQFAASAAGFTNARMEFDPATLRPLYRLTIGEAGKSYALQIAERLGLEPSVIRRSREIASMASPSGRLELPERKERRETAQAEAMRKSERQQDKREDRPFEIGDAVYVSSLRRTGIVCETKDKRGMVVVLIQKQRVTVNHKRLKLHVPREELYPDDYDMDIVLETKENRKKRHLMSRKHAEGIVIEKKGDEN